MYSIMSSAYVFEFLVIGGMTWYFCLRWRVVREHFD